jgi:hypothetical protein
VITEDDICNQLLDHWAEQNKPHLDDDEKCCYALAVRATDEIRRLRAEVEALRAGNARRDIELSIIETILTDGCNVDPTPIDIEHWSTTHDRLMEIMREVDALRSENWSLKCEVAGQLGERQALLQRTEEAEADAERYRWLTEDHDSKEMRNRCLEILSRMPVMSYSAACAAIDAARKGE